MMSSVVLLGWFILVTIPWLTVFIFYLVTHLTFFRRAEKWFNDTTTKLSGL